MTQAERDRKEAEEYLCNKECVCAEHLPCVYHDECADYLAGVQAERARQDERVQGLVDAIRAALGWFALWNDEKDQSKWPRYVKKCEKALAEYQAAPEGKE